MSENKLFFASDYMEGAHQNIIDRLVKTNYDHTVGYGMDEICASAKEKIKEACGLPNAEVEFLVGGTQTNATIISSILRCYQGVVSPESGHIAVHEAGAIEYRGNKVLTVPSVLGKMSAEALRARVEDHFNDGNHTHMVEPGMVYISQPTEYGTLYSLKELEDIAAVCREYKLPLYVDGARLAYAFGAKENDVTLKDLARLCDVFYIGGTKCGALFGEAVVLKDPSLIPGFFTIIKQQGALLAKGRMLGIQFDELFTNNLYFEVGEKAVSLAQRIQDTLRDAGYPIYLESPTNQIFFVIENSKMPALSEKVEYNFIEKYDDTHTVCRFCTSWATNKEDVDALVEIIKESAK